METYLRNNIYFMYLNNNKDYRYILIRDNDELYEFFSHTKIGLINDLFDIQDIVIAPIDLLLYHNSRLEHLHHNYSKAEKNLLKRKLIQPNIYRYIKTTYTEEEIKEIYEIINQMSNTEITWIINQYEVYFKNRKNDHVLRIRTY